MTNEDLRNELHQLSPTLARLKEEQEAFRVPSEYFQQMQTEVLNRLQSEKSEIPATKPLAGRWLDRLAEYVMALLQPRYALALAAMLIVAVGGWLLLNQGSTGNEPCADLACLTTEELKAFIFSNPDNFDLHTIMEAGISPDVLENIDLPVEGLQETDLQEYLDDHPPVLDATELEHLF